MHQCQKVGWKQAINKQHKQHEISYDETIATIQQIQPDMKNKEN